MATVSYGTITVTDLTDITDVYLEYCMTEAGLTASQVEAKITWTAPEREWGTTYPTWQSGYEIWIRQVQIKEGIEEPEYGTPYLDTAVNQINLSIGNINTELQTRLKYFWDNLTSHTHGNNWSKPDYPAGTYMAGGIENATFDKEDSDTYGYNTHYANGIKLRYNAINLTTLLHSGLSLYYPIVDNNNIIVNSTVGANFSASALSFFQPPTINGSNVIQGNKTLELNGNSLNFYGSDQNNADATLSSSGLKLVKGGIEAGTPNTNNFVYLSTDPYGPYTINDTEASDWKQIIGTNFGVRTDGSLYATNANIAGTIVANLGSIGGFTITANELYSGQHSAQDSNTEGIYIGNDILVFGSNQQTYFTNNGTGKIGSWFFNIDEIQISDNNNESNRIRQLTLGTNGIYLSNINTQREENINFILPSLDNEDDYISINILDKIIIEDNELSLNANNITANVISIGGIDIKNKLSFIEQDINTINNDKQAINEYLNSIKPYVIIGNDTITLKRWSNEEASYIKITDTTIELSLNQNIITEFKENLMHTTFGEFEKIRMRSTSGNLTWIARSNGHLSLKAVNE